MARDKIVDDGDARTTLRFPQSHKAAAEKAAERERRSLNFWLAEAVRMRLAAEGLLDVVPEKKGRRP